VDPAIETSVWGWLVVVLFAALAGLALRNIPGFWRGESRYWDKPQPWWPWGETLWRGYVRFMPTAVVNGVVLLLVYVVFAVVRVNDLPLPFKVFVFLWVAESFVTLFSIPLFNWPKAFVPPSLRHERGPILAWFHRAR
jgi:hypothetical protein